MKKFLFKVSLFCLLFIVIKVIIINQAPYHWGNVWYSSKIQHVEKIGVKPDVSFFGSSRIYRQIIPEVVDSIFQSRDLNYESYNFGATATFSPQTYYLYKNFINSELSKNLEIVFLELQNIPTIGNNIVHQERSSYWLSFEYLDLIMQSTIKRKDLSFFNKISIINKYSVAYLEHLLGLGYFQDEILLNDYYKNFYNGPNNDGFLSLDYEEEHDKDSNVSESRKMLDSENLENRFQKAIDSHLSFKNYDYTHLAYLEKMILDAKKRNIELVFVVPPRVSTPSLIALSKYLDAKVIDLSEFREFYEIENSYDNGHLNEKGARKFTIWVMNKYLGKDTDTSNKE